MNINTVFEVYQRVVNPTMLSFITKPTALIKTGNVVNGLFLQPDLFMVDILSMKHDGLSCYKSWPRGAIENLRNLTHYFYKDELYVLKDVPESITNEEVIKRIEEDGLQAVDIVLKKLK